MKVFISVLTMLIYEIIQLDAERLYFVIKVNSENEYIMNI